MLKKYIFEQPYRDVFHDVPVEYVQRIMKQEEQAEKERKKGWFEKTLLFLRLKKPWQPTSHVIYSD